MSTVNVIKLVDGSGFTFNSDALSSDQARALDEFLVDNGYTINRAVEEVKASTTQKSELDTFYGD